MTVFALSVAFGGLAVAEYIFFSGNWILVVLAAAADIFFAFGVVLVSYLLFGPALHTIQYWKYDLAQKGKFFPTTREERRRFRSWASDTLEGKITTASDALSEVMDIKAELDVTIDDQGYYELFKKIKIEKRLRIAQQEAEEANKQMERCQNFFFFYWPNGSGILADDSTDPQDHGEMPTSPSVMELVA